MATRIYWCWLSLDQRSKIFIFYFPPHFEWLFSKWDGKSKMKILPQRYSVKCILTSKNLFLLKNGFLLQHIYNQKILNCYMRLSKAEWTIPLLIFYEKFSKIEVKVRGQSSRPVCLFSFVKNLLEYRGLSAKMRFVNWPTLLLNASYRKLAEGYKL